MKLTRVRQKYTPFGGADRGVKEGRDAGLPVKFGVYANFYRMQRSSGAQHAP